MKKADLNTIISTIREELSKPSLDLSSDLWTVRHIANYLSVAHSTARDKIVRVKSFPRPRKIVTDNGTMKRWDRDAVKAWVKKH